MDDSIPGRSGENNCSSSKIESLSLSLGLARGFIGFRGRAAPSFFQVAARSREVASSSIIRLRPSHLTNVSVRFHIAASFLVPSPWILDSSRISHSYTLSLFLSLSRVEKTMSRRASRQFLDRSRFSIPDLTFLLGKISLILITIFVCTAVIWYNLVQFFFGRIGILNGLERKKERRKLDWMDNSSRGTLLYAVLHFRGLRFTTLLWRPASAVTRYRGFVDTSSGCCIYVVDKIRHCYYRKYSLR